MSIDLQQRGLGKKKQRRAEAQRAQTRKTEGNKEWLKKVECAGKRKNGQFGLPAGELLKVLNWGAASCAPHERQKLFEFFGHYRELQLGLGQGLDDDGLGAFRGGVARGGHLADEKILRAFEHFLFAEGEGLAAAEGNEALEDDGDFEEGTGAHALGVFLEAVLPVVVRVEFALFEEAKDFDGFRGTNHGTKANGFMRLIEEP